MPLKAHFMDESCQITEGIYWEECVTARMDKSMHSTHSKLLPISCHAHSKKQLKNWQPQTPGLEETKKKYLLVNAWKKCYFEDLTK